MFITAKAHAQSNWTTENGATNSTKEIVEEQLKA